MPRRMPGCLDADQTARQFPAEVESDQSVAVRLQATRQFRTAGGVFGFGHIEFCRGKRGLAGGIEQPVGVIGVNMGQEDGVNPGRRDSKRRQPFRQGPPTGAVTGIDQNIAIPASHQKDIDRGRKLFRKRIGQRFSGGGEKRPRHGGRRILKRPDPDLAEPEFPNAFRRMNDSHRQSHRHQQP
ncbi:hypothetical protein SDC9_144557 [bioreactor metagenome]|uniref:Uncharacterized protein n=1 Tax=bioreactor metagenome TaxID=1076179 RepID=A0A645E6D4_9ZZZZ